MLREKKSHKICILSTENGPPKCHYTTLMTVYILCFLPLQIFIIKKWNFPQESKGLWDGKQLKYEFYSAYLMGIILISQHRKHWLVYCISWGPMSINFKYFNSILYRVIPFIWMFFWGNREATLSRKEEKYWFYAFKLGEEKSVWLKIHELKTFWKLNS